MWFSYLKTIEPVVLWIIFYGMSGYQQMIGLGKSSETTLELDNVWVMYHKANSSYEWVVES